MPGVSDTDAFDRIAANAGFRHELERIAAMSILPRSEMAACFHNNHASSHHFVHGDPQPTGTDPLPNRPYEPCCRRNEDEAACVGKGGEKSASADQSIANASTESRENEMGQTVRFSSGLLRRFASTGDYQIVKRLPDVGDEKQYIIKSALEPCGRVAKESELEKV